MSMVGNDLALCTVGRDLRQGRAVGAVGGRAADLEAGCDHRGRYRRDGFQDRFAVHFRSTRLLLRDIRVFPAGAALCCEWAAKPAPWRISAIPRCSSSRSRMNSEHLARGGRRLVPGLLVLGMAYQRAQLLAVGVGDLFAEAFEVFVVTVDQPVAPALQGCGSARSQSWRSSCPSVRAERGWHPGWDAHQLADKPHVALRYR